MVSGQFVLLLLCAVTGDTAVGDTGEDQGHLKHAGNEDLLSGGRCSDNRCQNGGQCLDEGDHYTCRCPLEWTGRFCEEDVNECLLEPAVCKNGATCVNAPGGYTCYCANGWSGADCSEDTDDCLSSPCSSESTCVDRLAGFLCLCPPGKTGSLCHLDDACTRDPCGTGQECKTHRVTGRATCITAAKRGEDPHGTTTEQVLCGWWIIFSAESSTNQNYPASSVLWAPSCGQCPVGSVLWAPFCGQHPVGSILWGSVLWSVSFGRRPVGSVLWAVSCGQRPVSTDEGLEPHVTWPQPVQSEDFNGHLSNTGHEGSMSRGRCSVNQCQNGGQCLDEGDHYTCRCPLEWTGRFCEEDVNECLLEPAVCKNGATCVNAPGGYTCYCANGWSGADCSEDTDDCLSSPCSSGSTCVDRLAGFLCLCPPGKTGSLCHLEDACIRDPCGTGQECKTHRVTGRATCITAAKRGELNFCSKGLEVWINEGNCSDNLCQSGSQCLDSGDHYTCRCPPQWKGRFCEEDVDECLRDSAVCKNGGTCSNLPGGYTCICVNGWSGVDCSENIDDCLNDPCIPEATCVDRVASFFCMCPHGKTGLLCHLDDACVGDPCAEGQSCMTNPVNGRVYCH
ncbi:hypothetical protein NFI96_025796 [Prochilodus magdalenae]|nr:hypothetical protein NFI96_025796 [Prochilodus magdalenae]